MIKSKILVSLIVIFSILFLVFQFNGNYLWSEYSRCLIIPLITIAYFVNIKRKTIYFTTFLVLYSLSELMIFGIYFIHSEIDYLLGNGLYIAAYLSLVIGILRTMDISFIINNFSMHLIVLLVLNVYVIYVLLKIETPHLVSYENVVEFVYNIVTLLLLSVSLLNYFYKDNKKSLILFFGSLCIVFSEVIQIAYFYITDKDLLNITYSTLLILAFYFYYSQAKIRERKRVNRVRKLIRNVDQ